MKISGSIISFLSGAFLFGSVSLTNGANAETPSIHDILDKHAPIQRGQGYTTNRSDATGSAIVSNMRVAYKEVLDTLGRDYNFFMEGRHLMKYLEEGDLRKKPAAPKHKAGLHTPIRIVVDDAPLRSRIQTEDDGYNAAVIALADQVLPRVVQTFESMLFVESPMDAINLRNRRSTCGERNLPLPVDPMLTGDFHIIFDGTRDSEDDICRDYPNLAAVSEACSFDLWPFNPRAGIVSICLDRVNVDSTGMVGDEEIERLVSLQLGEMAIALGATSDLFSFYTDITTGLPVGYAVTTDTCLDGTAVLGGRLPANVQKNSYGDSITKDFFEVTTPLVTQVVRNIFDCQSMTGARLENQPFKPSASDGNCIGDGWDMRLFHEEVLSNHVDASEAAKTLSPITLALLEDSGWYKVDFSKAGAISFGSGAGCSFVDNDCIDSMGYLNEGSRGSFCNQTETDFKECDPSYHSQAFCNLDYLDISGGIPVQYQYFPLKPTAAGTVEQYDYCPVPIDSLHPCDAGKRCFRRVGEESLCLDAECIEGEVVFTCQSDFQEIEVEGLTQKIECPRLAAFCPEIGCLAACSGRGVCIWDKRQPKCACEGKYKNEGCFLDARGGTSNAVAKRGKKSAHGLRRRRAIQVRGRKS